MSIGVFSHSDRAMVSGCTLAAQSSAAQPSFPGSQVGLLPNAERHQTDGHSGHNWWPLQVGNTGALSFLRKQHGIV